MERLNLLSSKSSTMTKILIFVTFISLVMFTYLTPDHAQAEHCAPEDIFCVDDPDIGDFNIDAYDALLVAAAQEACDGADLFEDCVYEVLITWDIGVAAYFFLLDPEIEAELPASEDPVCNPACQNDGVCVEGNVCDPDVDGDGVLYADDACVPTAIGEVADSEGCSISDYIPCEQWKNHGAYVSNLTKEAKRFLDEGLITRKEKNAIVTEAAQSQCGKKKK